MAKVSEDTITTIFQEILNESGLKGTAFPIWETPSGIRKPDILISNKKLYPLEAKIWEKDLIKDFVKIQNDYFKHAETLNIGGAFVLKHPNPTRLKLDLNKKEMKKKLKTLNFKLISMFPQDDPRQFEIIEGKLDKLIPIIKETVNYERIIQELEPKAAVEILRISTKLLESVLKGFKMEFLVEKMGGFELFDDILDIKTKKEYNSFKIATSFFILTQLLFYHVAAFYREDLKNLEEIKSTSDLNTNYFNKILDKNYKVIFGIDLASHLPNAAVETINKIILTLKSLRPENIKGDLLGTVFHDLIPLTVRKRVAAYYTNIMTTQLLAELTIDNSNETIIDLACGSGGLLVSAYQKKRRLILENLNFVQEDHEEFINNHIFGIDIMPFSVNVASCNLALQSPEYLTNSVNIALWDSIDLKPGDVIPEFANLKHLFRTSTLEKWITLNGVKKTRRISQLSDSAQEEMKLKKCDVVLMNPPFTRQERLPISYKTKIKMRFDKTYRGIYNDRMSLYGFFILLADIFIKKQGRIGFVLPASFLARESFKELREFICKKYNIKMIVFNASRLNFSESTLFREILIILKNDNEIKGTTKVCKLIEYPSTHQDVIRLAEDLRKEKTTKDCEIIKYDQNELLKLNKTDDWASTIIFSKLLHEIYNFIKNNDGFESLGLKYDCTECDLRHFSLTDQIRCIFQNESKAYTKKLKESWVVEKINDDVLNVTNSVIENVNFSLPLSKLGRGLRTTSSLRVINVDDELDYILVSSFKGYKNKYLRYMLPREQIEKFKSSNFDKIRKNFDNKKGHLILNRRLFLASPGTSYVAFNSKYPFIGIDTWSFHNIDKNAAKLLSLWMNSSFGLIQLLMVGVAIEGNWMKIHKYMLKRIYIPKTEAFLGKYEKELNELYDKVSKIKAPSLKEQLKTKNKLRKQIDEFFIRKLNIDFWKEHETLEKSLIILQDELLSELKVLSD